MDSIVVSEAVEDVPSPPELAFPLKGSKFRRPWLPCPSRCTGAGDRLGTESFSLKTLPPALSKAEEKPLMSPRLFRLRWVSVELSVPGLRDLLSLPGAGPALLRFGRATGCRLALRDECDCGPAPFDGRLVLDAEPILSGWKSKPSRSATSCLLFLDDFSSFAFPSNFLNIVSVSTTDNTCNRSTIILALSAEFVTVSKSSSWSTFEFFPFLTFDEFLFRVLILILVSSSSNVLRSPSAMAFVVLSSSSVRSSVVINVFAAIISLEPVLAKICKQSLIRCDNE
mmetsp:Transcript_32957/g.79729  ORF Transcript_32957/g.79729 Transcript_32957/m.79729 type:complete len:283 (+) Transcript_32957:1044-1892(+)